jgi:hypothetical protein
MDTLVLQFGVVDTALENAAYALSRNRRVSNPVRTESFGTGVLVLQEETPNRTMLQQPLPDRRRSVERALKDREENLLGRAYLGSILSPQKAVVDPGLFDSLAAATRDVLLADSSGQKRGSGHDLTLAHVDAVSARLQAHLRERLVTIGGDGMALAEVLEGFRNERFKFPVLTDPEFMARLSGSLKMVVQQELMSREAIRQGLQNTPEVRRDLSVWSSYWTARAMEQQIAAEVTVSDSEVTAFLVRGGAILGKAYEVNVREILSSSLGESLEMAERLLGGEDMAALAQKSSRRGEWAAQGGESGFFRVSEHPGLGFAALAQDSGTMGGPVALPEGYSIFPVLGKRQVLNDSIPAYTTLRENARRLVHAQHVQKSLNRFLADLAGRQAIRIDYVRLRQIQLVPSNMVTTRYIGFGGAMLAVPMIHPQYRWIDEVPDKTGLVP